jgi:hypothetical protein
MQRMSCAHCASQLFGKNGQMKNALLVLAGTIENAHDWTVRHEIYCNQRLPWLPEVPGARQLPEGWNSKPKERSRL